MSKVLKSDGTVLVGGAFSDVGEGVGVRLFAHTGTGEVLFYCSHSIQSEVGNICSILQIFILQVQI